MGANYRQAGSTATYAVQELSARNKEDRHLEVGRPEFRPFGQNERKAGTAKDGIRVQRPTTRVEWPIPVSL